MGQRPVFCCCYEGKKLVSYHQKFETWNWKKKYSKEFLVSSREFVWCNFWDKSMNSKINSYENRNLSQQTRWWCEHVRIRDRFQSVAKMPVKDYDLARNMRFSKSNDSFIIWIFWKLQKYNFLTSKLIAQQRFSSKSSCLAFFSSS